MPLKPVGFPVASSDNGASSVFGSEYDFFNEPNVPINDNTTAFVTLSTFNTSILSIGSFRASIAFRWTYSNVNRSGVFQFLVDGSLVVLGASVEVNNLSDTLLYNDWNIFFFGTATTHTVEIQFSSEQAGDVTDLLSCRYDIYKVSNSDVT